MEKNHMDFLANPVLNVHGNWRIEKEKNTRKKENTGKKERKDHFSPYCPPLYQCPNVLGLFWGSLFYFIGLYI